MKIKRTTKSILSIIVAVLIIAGTSMVSAGAATQKTYLKDMLYSEIVTDSNENRFTTYNGNDYNDHQCTNAIKYYVISDDGYYPDDVIERGTTSYIISYKLDGKYNEFISSLTHDDLPSNDVNVEIFTDNKLVYSIGLTDESPLENISIDTNNVQLITIKINCFVKWIGGHADIIFDNAYFTSEGSAPVETTVKPTVPTTTAKPITQATTAKATTATVATTKPVAATASSATTATSSTKATVAAPATNATFKISTADTANKTNTSSGSANNGTVQTGAASIAIIVFLIIGSLVTGSYAIYRKKKN